MFNVKKMKKMKKHKLTPDQKQILNKIKNSNNTPIIAHKYKVTIEHGEACMFTEHKCDKCKAEKLDYLNSQGLFSKKQLLVYALDYSKYVLKKTSASQMPLCVEDWFAKQKKDKYNK